MAWRERGVALVLWLVVTLASPGNIARAGGSEFPADGTRGLGRGGTGMTRADDPTVMIRNPALLADLWDDQAMLGAHLLLVDSCFTPSGAYGWGISTADVSDYGDGPVWLQAPAGSVDADGDPIDGFVHEPFPTICYDGPAPFLPQFGLTNKLSDDLGVGLAFLPPESQQLSAFGERDGTIVTPEGRRPNPLRYYTTNENISFFTLTGGIGYRISPLIRVGLALQWNLVVANARSWTTAITGRKPSNDVATDVFFRDLFVPGLAASVHLVPTDSLDVAVSFRWTEQLDGKAKLDLTSGFFGTGEVLEVYDAGDPDAPPTRLGSAIPTTTNNQPGFVFAPPIYAPQLSFGVRYADRIEPRPDDWAAARAAGGGRVQDAMATERWDIELNAIYYFNSTYDEIGLISENARVQLRSVDSTGREATPIEADVGDCSVPEVEMRVDGAVSSVCPGQRQVVTRQGGKDQLSLRIGGDYNLLPGVFALRGGLSYETDGADVELLNVRNYMLRRIGLHAGVTLRVAGKTDISLGFAHFIHRDVRLQVNPDSRLEPRYWTEEYGVTPGLGFPPQLDESEYDDAAFDGVAGYEVPNAGQLVGPHYVNAGSFVYHLQVLSLTVTQHF